MPNDDVRTILTERSRREVGLGPLYRRRAKYLGFVGGIFALNEAFSNRSPWGWLLSLVGLLIIVGGVFVLSSLIVLSFPTQLRRIASFIYWDNVTILLAPVQIAGGMIAVILLTGVLCVMLAVPMDWINAVLAIGGLCFVVVCLFAGISWASAMVDEFRATRLRVGSVRTLGIILAAVVLFLLQIPFSVQGVLSAIAAVERGVLALATTPAHRGRPKRDVGRPISPGFLSPAGDQAPSSDHRAYPLSP